MIAYRQFVTVKNSRQIILSDLPFQPGQQVEVVVIAEETPATDRVNELRELFSTTQSFAQAQAISEEEIAAEIAAYRSGQ